MFCTKCGNKVPDYAKFCGKCGCEMQKVIPEVMVDMSDKLPVNTLKEKKSNLSNKKAVIGIVAAVVIVILFAMMMKPKDSKAPASVSNNNSTYQPSMQDKEQQTEQPTTQEEVDLAGQLIENIIAEKGVVVADKFVTCTGTYFEKYPDEAFGFAGSIEKDLNKDGVDELIIAEIERISDSNGNIVVSVYKLDNGQYVETARQNVAMLDSFGQHNISLYYAYEVNSYCIFVDTCISGSYTRSVELIGTVYTVNENSIEFNGKWDWNNVINGPNNIADGLHSVGVAYAKNCETFGNTVDCEYEVLLEIVAGSNGALDYSNLVNYLQIITNDYSDASYGADISEEEKIQEDKNVVDMCASAAAMVLVDPDIKVFKPMFMNIAVVKNDMLVMNETPQTFEEYVFSILGYKNICFESEEFSEAFGINLEMNEQTGKVTAKVVDADGNVIYSTTR